MYQGFCDVYKKVTVSFKVELPYNVIATRQQATVLWSQCCRECPAPVVANVLEVFWILFGSEIIDFKGIFFGLKSTSSI